MKLNYSVYLVTDREMAGECNLADIVVAAVSGGVSCVQIREKNLPTRRFVEEARGLVEHLRPLGIPLIVNDRVDVALACDADGVHLGQNDMHIKDARSLLGGQKIIGISAESLADARRAELEGADYIGISPVFATATKADIAKPLGLGGVRIIRDNVQLPLVGIGGISAANAADVIQHGADGVAVVSAIIAAESPEASARELLQQVTSAKRIV
ncbi:thiamine phosphate synthase [Desulfosediminicola ganghwensis]|uniref:thiamine phosphate synthase n=1 Tax=Desulfosediminicola ganghwensis TaxID=2569540 RepID=UPI0010ACAE84|nr:thiamine phosphate synthase [Desulfosediminicola ganghwensis]